MTLHKEANFTLLHVKKLFAQGEYILYFEYINLSICNWDRLEHQQSQGK